MKKCAFVSCVLVAIAFVALCGTARADMMRLDFNDTSFMMPDSQTMNGSNAPAGTWHSSFADGIGTFTIDAGNSYKVHSWSWQTTSPTTATGAEIRYKATSNLVSNWKIAYISQYSGPKLYIGGTSYTSGTETPNINPLIFDGQWHTATFDFPTAIPVNVFNIYVAPAGTAMGQLQLDYVQFVPEPATIGLLAAGLFGLIRRRRA